MCMHGACNYRSIIYHYMIYGYSMLVVIEYMFKMLTALRVFCTTAVKISVNRMIHHER